MATLSTSHHPDGRTFTVTSVPVVGLDMRPYVEYRLEERDAAGAFLGYCAFGSRGFVEQALAAKLTEFDQGDTTGASVCAECSEGIAAGEVFARDGHDLCGTCYVQLAEGGR